MYYVIENLIINKSVPLKSLRSGLTILHITLFLQFLFFTVKVSFLARDLESTGSMFIMPK